VVGDDDAGGLAQGGLEVGGVERGELRGGDGGDLAARESTAVAATIGLSTTGKGSSFTTSSEAAGDCASAAAGMRSRTGRWSVLMRGNRLKH
jgi:hypothetical protein